MKSDIANARTQLLDLVAAELSRPLTPGVGTFGEHLVRGRTGALAVLFYGSTLRTGDLDGLLDYYIIVDHLSNWHDNRLAALANGWLPPNVSYETFDHAGKPLRAKVAVLSLAQFQRGMRNESFDTTLWARFAQPVGLVWARDIDARRSIESVIGEAIINAAHWAAILGPEHGTAGQYWSELFRHTYAAELRVEGASTRSKSLIDHEIDRYTRLLPLAWRCAGLDFTLRSQRLTPRLTDRDRRQGRRAWALRHRLGKPLNMARLLKATFTFRNGADYVAWKVERHSGYKLELNDWQRKHPLLAAPVVLWKLRRNRVIR